MGTFFEVLTPWPDSAYAEQAADAAFAEIDRLEQKLSRYRENSDVSRINRLSAGESIRVSPETIACLEQCRELHELTHGAFDITVGPLVDHWRSGGSGESRPLRIGWEAITLDPRRRLVALTQTPITLDLGGYGKGYALDRMSQRLREWEISHFLGHSGQSTYLGADSDGSRTGWQITAQDPAHPGRQVGKALLRNQALSASGMEKGRHIIDPRTGNPVTHCAASWCVAPDAAKADALSTAFMVMSPAEIVELRRRQPEVKALQLLAEARSDGSRIIRQGWNDGQ